MFTSCFSRHASGQMLHNLMHTLSFQGEQSSLSSHSPSCFSGGWEIECSDLIDLETERYSIDVCLLTLSKCSVNIHSLQQHISTPKHRAPSLLPSPHFQAPGNGATYHPPVITLCLPYLPKVLPLVSLLPLSYSPPCKQVYIGKCINHFLPNLAVFIEKDNKINH